MNRKEFIKNTSLATAGITILNFPVFGKNAPSNKVIVAVMGVNSRGFIIYGDKGTLVNKGNDDYTIYDADNKLVKEVKTGATNDGKKDGSRKFNFISPTAMLLST